MPVVRGSVGALSLVDPVDFLTPVLSVVERQQKQQALALEQQRLEQLNQYRQSQLALQALEQGRLLEQQRIEQGKNVINTLTNLYKATKNPELQYDYISRIISTTNDIFGTNLTVPNRDVYFSNQNAYKTLLNELDKTVKDKGLSPEQKEQKILLIQSEVNKLGQSERFAPLVKGAEKLITSERLKQRGLAAEKLIPGIGEAVRTGVPTPIITQAVKPPEEKPLTLSQSDAQLMQKAFRVGIENLNPAEQARFNSLTAKRGISFRVAPDGTIEFAQGAELGEPTPAFKTQIQKETADAVKSLQEFRALRQKVTPESFGITSELAKAIQETFEFISPGSTPKWAADITRNRDKLFRQINEAFALWIKALTGVQFGEKEAKRLKKGFPNQGDNYAEFMNKLDDIEDSYIRSIARLKRFGYPSDKKIRTNIFNSVPLSDITPAEIEAVKKEFGISSDKPDYRRLWR
jgi:hypothetical protein